MKKPGRPKGSKNKTSMAEQSIGPILSHMYDKILSMEADLCFLRSRAQSHSAPPEKVCPWVEHGDHGFGEGVKHEYADGRCCSDK